MCRKGFTKIVLDRLQIMGTISDINQGSVEYQIAVITTFAPFPVLQLKHKKEICYYLKKEYLKNRSINKAKEEQLLQFCSS